MDHHQEVTFTVRRLINQIRRLTEGRMPPDQRITPMQGRVIGFVKHHCDQDVYQRDLEQEFQIRRSTASAILKTMEQGDLIRREAVARDARLKKLVLTPRAEVFSDRFLREMERAEAVITQGVTREELDAFFCVTAKFERNLMDYVSACESAACRERCGKEKA